MKKLLLISIFISVATTLISFRSDPYYKELPFLKSVCLKKHYHIHVTESFTFGGCQWTFGIWVDFDWTGPGHPPTNISYSNGTINISNCPPHVSHAVYVKSSTFDSSTGYIISLEFERTGDDDADSILSDPSNVQQIMNDINAQIT